MIKNPVVVITGPTACGKTKLAVDLAKQINGVIINCDSMQIYKGIPVLSAAPTAEEMNGVEHRLFEIYDCDKNGNVFEWLDACVSEVRSVWQKHRIPIIVGGTGMYVEALLKGISPIPPVSLEIRQAVRRECEEKGLESIYEHLKEIDPDTAQKLAPKDTTRILRAVEIFKSTGKKMSDWQKIPPIKQLPEAGFVVVKLFPTLQEIESRCRERLDIMVNELGVLKEVTDLLSRNLPNDLPAMKALGVPEFAQFIRGNMNLEEALDLAKLHTRQYAKRQRTWLKGKINADVEFNFVYNGQKDYINQITNKLGFK